MSLIRRVVSGRERRGQAGAEELDHRDEHEVREHAAGAHDRGDARADDVADAEQLGRDLGGDRAGRERRAEDLLRRVLPAAEARPLSAL